MAQAFDPAAATAAYLAQLPPQAHAKAQAYTQGGHWLLLWSALAGVVVAWLILRSGLLVRLRRAAGGAAHPWRSAALVLLVYSLVEGVLLLPWVAYAQWWREGQYGLTSQPFAGWVVEWAMSLAIGAVITMIPLLFVYWLIRRAPRTWWAWSGLVVAAAYVVILVLQPVFIEPLFNSYTPAPPGPVRDSVEALAKANRVPSDKILIYNGSRQSNRYTANVAGLFGTARIAMSDVMFRKDADMPEVRAVVAHEMGHYVLGHNFQAAAFFGVIAAVGLFLVDRLFGPTARIAGARGIEGLSDPAGYPVIAMLLAVLLLVGEPLTSGFTRLGEAQADSFSLERANEPDGLARALVKTIEYRAATPSRLEEILFYDHPSVGSRVRKAMDWKARHSPSPAPAVTVKQEPVAKPPTVS
jgi:STE24 endopeptidase